MKTARQVRTHLRAMNPHERNPMHDTAQRADIEVTGVHPYADKFPMLPDSELDELAESIKTVGLLHPIVVTPDGLILDGRNRLEACNRAEVEASLEVYDGEDYAEFVIASNVARRNMSVGARAMSTALVLYADGRRENGRWSYGHVRESFATKDSQGLSVAISKCGSVLDHSPDLAQDVVDGALPLDEAYRRALSAKDESDRRAADEANAERYEAEAKADLEESAPEYLAKVEDGTYDSHRTARAVWLEHDRAAKRERETREREYRESLQRDANRVKAFLSGYSATWRIATDNHPKSDEVLELLNSVERRRFYEIKEQTAWPTQEI